MLEIVQNWKMDTYLEEGFADIFAEMEVSKPSGKESWGCRGAGLYLSLFESFAGAGGKRRRGKKDAGFCLFTKIPLIWISAKVGLIQSAIEAQELSPCCLEQIVGRLSD